MGMSAFSASKFFAERGLTRRLVALWFYEDRLHVLHVEYKQTLLARYRYRLERR